MVFLHLDPCRWSAETDRCSHLVIGVHLKCLSVNKWFFIDLWPCFFSPSSCVTVSTLLLRIVGARVGVCFEISVRSPETAPRNRSDALTAAHMLCDGVMFSLYPRWHAAALCICRTKWLYLSLLASVRVCIGWRWGISSGIWLMALKHCPDFLLLFCKV